MFLFDQVLIGPSHEELLRTVREAGVAACQTAHWGPDEIVPPAPASFFERWAKEARGVMQWLGRVRRGHAGGNEHYVVAVAWWTDHIGRKHSRVVGHRGTLSEGERQNLFSPGDEDRPDLCLVYPDHAFVRRDWLARDLWVACPCGMAGLPQRLGWMGPCCAACHDRREEGMAAGLPSWPPHLSSRTPFERVSSLAFSPDGGTLASVGLGSGVWLWDIQAGGGKQSGTAANNVRVHFLRGGKRLLLSNPWAHLIMTLDGDRARSLSAGGAFAALPSRNGQVALVYRDRVELVNPHIGGALSGTVYGHVRPIRCAALSPNGHLLATGSEDRTVIVWDLSLFQERTTFRGFRGPVAALAFSPDGRRLAVGFGEREVLVWDIEAGKTLSLEEFSEPIWAIEFSPDGRTLALAAGDLHGPRAAPDRLSRPGCLFLYDANTGRRRAVLEWHTGAVLCLAFSPDGEWLATGGADGLVRLWPWQQLLEA